MNDICERSVKCPIYSGILKSNEMMINTYKQLYCNAGAANYNKCKRFQVAKVAGSCPPHILPNSQLSIGDILKQIDLQKIA